MGKYAKLDAAGRVIPSQMDGPHRHADKARAPTPADDTCPLLSLWLHNRRVYVCVGNEAGAAVWREITGPNPMG